MFNTLVLYHDPSSNSVYISRCGAQGTKGFASGNANGVEMWAGIIENTCLLSALFRLVCMVLLKRVLAPLMGHETGFLHHFP